MAELPAVKRGMEATSSQQQSGKKDQKRPRPPPGISGTVANLVISPDWFASKEANQRERFWWSPGNLSLHDHIYSMLVFYALDSTCSCAV
jgi:hypothetical protein